MDKPPLGVEPFYIAAERRIKELGAAIVRYADSGATKPVRAWSQEITELCNLLDTLWRAQEQ